MFASAITPAFIRACFQTLVYTLPNSVTDATELLPLSEGGNIMTRSLPVTLINECVGPAPYLRPYGALGQRIRSGQRSHRPGRLTLPTNRRIATRSSIVAGVRPTRTPASASTARSPHASMSTARSAEQNEMSQRPNIRQRAPDTPTRACSSCLDALCSSWFVSQK